MRFVTFSRPLGSQGAEVAKKVAEELGYRLIDTQAIDDKAREMGFLESIEKIDERVPSLFQRLLTHKPEMNLGRLNAVIYELAKEGDAVFVGRGGQLLLKSFDCALHVRVIASKERRIRNLMETGFTKESAEKAIERSDHERSGFIKFAFGVNWDDPRLYDVVFNMDKLSVELAVVTVLVMARSSEMKICSIDAMDSLGMLSLKARAEAALIESGLSYGQANTINVQVDAPGKVKLTGILEDRRSKTRAEEVLKTVTGVDVVDNQIRVTPADRHA